jgi:hypothetical protein
MEFRDVETREAILREQERLAFERNKQRTNLIRAQHEEMDRFSDDRRRARSRIRCDLSELPSPDGTACSAAAKAAPARRPAKKHSTLFLAGRGKFLDSQQVRVGRFKKRDEKNLDTVLDSADRQCCRQRLERAYLRRFENRGGNAPAPSRPDGLVDDVSACEGMAVNDSDAEQIANTIQEEDWASDSET